MDRMEFQVDDLLLDLDNPRIGHVSSQAAALEAIYLLNPEHFKTMMRSIKDHGLDPGDSFYIVDEGDSFQGYTVVDGNRRLAAIKVLTNAAVLHGTHLARSALQQLETIANGFNHNEITSVGGVLFDSRADANEWILRRHGRGMEGEGRIAWNPLETQRFQNDWTVLDVIKFVEVNSEYSVDAWAPIKAAVEKNSSTLRRFLDSKPGREHLGIEIMEEGLLRIPAFRKDPKYILGVLVHLFSDIAAERVNSRSYNKASEISEYFGALEIEDRPDELAAGLVKFRESLIGDGETRPRQQEVSESAARPQRTSRPPPIRRTLAPTRHAFQLPSTEKGRQLLREASRVKLNEMPLASSYLLRAFFEYTIASYMEKNGIPAWEGGNQLDLSKRATRVFDHMQSSGILPNAALRGPRRLLSQSEVAGIAALNDYHHNQHQTPAADALRTAWEAMIPVFTAVFGRV